MYLKNVHIKQMFKQITRGGLGLISLPVVSSPVPPTGAPPLAPSQSLLTSGESFVNGGLTVHVEGTPLNTYQVP